MSGYTDIGCEHWLRSASGRFDKIGVKLADGHYSRRKPGSPQFLPPGNTLVLISRDQSAVWAWWRPDPGSGLKLMSGLDGWTCSIFRNTGPILSSELVVDAEKALAVVRPDDCGPDGMLTYVWDAKVRSTNPGFCYKLAGWKRRGRSADKKKTLLTKPFDQAGVWPMEEKDLSMELWREYDFGGRVYRIEDPAKLFYRVGGTTHRILDSNGVAHCVPAPGQGDCVLRWQERDGTPGVTF